MQGSIYEKDRRWGFLEAGSFFFFGPAKFRPWTALKETMHSRARSGVHFQLKSLTEAVDDKTLG